MGVVLGGGSVVVRGEMEKGRVGSDPLAWPCPRLLGDVL